MPEPQGIALSLSNRRAVLKDDPEYNRLLLALRDEQPEALQDDEIAHLQTLSAPNFRTQNDPVADRARLEPAYESTMGPLLERGAVEDRDPAMEALPTPTMRDMMNRRESADTSLVGLATGVQRDVEGSLPYRVGATAARSMGAGTSGMGAFAGALLDRPGDATAIFEGLQTAARAPVTPLEEQTSMAQAARDRGVDMGAPGVLLDMIMDPLTAVAPEKLLMAGMLPIFGKASKGAGVVAQMAKRGKPWAQEAQNLLTRLTPSLEPTQLKHLEGALSQSPALMEHLQFLKPEEIPALLRSKGALTKFAANVEALPSVNMLKAAAAIGDVKLGWYERSRQAIESLFGADADLFAGILASTSPQTSVDSNLTNALNFFVNWKAAGRSTDPDTIRAILNASVQGGADKSALNAWVPNLISVVSDNAQTLSGSKVDSFWANLRSRWKETPYGKIAPDQAVVLDAWMSHMFGVPGEKWFGGSGVDAAQKLAGDPGLKGTYLAATARTRAVAQALGISPSEAQETIWSTAYALYNKSQKTKLSPSEVLRQGLLTPADISGTPDFASLFIDSTKNFGAIVARDPELAQRVPALAQIPVQQNRTLPRDATFQQGMTDIGTMMGRLQDARKAERGLATSVTPKDTQVLFAPTEVVGDRANTSILPYDDVQAAQRSSVSRKIASAAENTFGHNAALRAVVEADAPQQTRQISAMGSWLEKFLGGRRLQQNPMSGTGLIVPDNPTARRKIEQQVRAVTDVQAGLRGQTAQTHVVLDLKAPSDRWNAVDASGSANSKPIQAGQFQALVQALPPEWVAIHKERGVTFLHLDPATGNSLPVTAADTAQMLQNMQTYVPQVDAKGVPFTWSVRGAENVAEKGYRTIAGDAPEGSRLRTGRMVGVESDWAKLPAAKRKAADPHFQREATIILEEAKRIKRTLRADERNLLQIVAKGGASALAKALKDPSQVLPALAVLGLTWPALTADERRPSP